jgi:hypothetical protein
VASIALAASRTAPSLRCCQHDGASCGVACAYQVPEVNPAQIPFACDKMLFKSPNCVSVGTSLGLKAIEDAFGLMQVSVCTFQSLSGRGDAMYPAELVQGNIYPVWNTKECARATPPRTARPLVSARICGTFSPLVMRCHQRDVSH